MGCRLVYQEEGREISHALDRDEVGLGRGTENEIVINNASVSRNHARLERSGGAWRVRDLGSTNGTRVNDQPPSERPLSSGDRISLGTQEFTFVDDEAGPRDLLVSGPAPGSETVYRTTVDFGGLVATTTHSGIQAIQSRELEVLVQLISEASKAMLASASLDEIFRKTLDLVLDHLRVDRGFVMLWNEERQDLVLACSRSRAGGGDGEMMFSRTIAEKVLRERVAVMTQDAQLDDRFANRGSVASLGIRSAIAAPLWNGDKVDGLICLDSTTRPEAFRDFDLDMLSALGHHLAVAVEQSRLQALAMEKQRLDRELAVARDIQMDTLPQEVPSLQGYDLGGLSRPADETGGDTYDLIPIGEDRLMLLLGDATGHGIGPALSATQVRSMLRVAMRLQVDLGSAFRHINDQLVQDLSDNRFVTAFLGVLDASSHTLTYQSGGQGPILHFHAASGTFDWHPATTFPMGFLPVKELPPPATLKLEPGDIVGLITDGVFEAENPVGQMFKEAGVEQILRAQPDLSAAEMVRVLLAAVDGHAGGEPQADDITIVLVRRSGSGELKTGPASRGQPTAPGRIR